MSLARSFATVLMSAAIVCAMVAQTKVKIKVNIEDWGNPDSGQVWRVYEQRFDDFVEGQDSVNQVYLKQSLYFQPDTTWQLLEFVFDSVIGRGDVVIYSTPASRQDLRATLNIVRPQKVYLFAVPPQQEKTDGFLSRLAGLAKFVINQRAGKVTLQELAGVTGQREKAVEIGQEWLAAGGHITIERLDGTILLSRGKGETNQYLQKELFIAVKGILEETAAYRAHFIRANLDSLFEQDPY